MFSVIRAITGGHQSGPHATQKAAEMAAIKASKASPMTHNVVNDKGEIVSSFCRGEAMVDDAEAGQ